MTTPPVQRSTEPPSTHDDAASADAAPRRKPIYRPRNIAIAVILPILSVGIWVTVETLRVYNATPAWDPAFDDELIDLAHASAGFDTPDKRNAAAARWRQLGRIATDIQTIIENNHREISPPQWRLNQPYEIRPDFRYLVYADKVPAEIEHERAVLRLIEDAGLFKELDDLAAQPLALSDDLRTHFWIMDTDPMIDVLMARSRLAVNDGDFALLTQTFRQAACLSRALMHQPQPGLSLMWGYENCANYFIGHLRRLLLTYEIPPQVCRELDGILDEFRTFRPETFKRLDWLDIERLHRGRHTPPGDDDGHLIPYTTTPGGSEASASVLLFRSFESRFILPDQKTYLDRIRKLHDRTFKAALARDEPALRSLPQPMDGTDFATGNFRGTYQHALVIERSIPQVGGQPLEVVSQYRKFQRDIAVTRIMLAIEQFQAAHNRLPDSLDELTPEFLVLVPLDPVPGVPFAYVKNASPDEESSPYTLTSLGFDGKPGMPEPAPGDGPPFDGIDLLCRDEVMNVPY